MPNPIKNTQAAQGNWGKSGTNAKALIVCNLGPVAIVRRRKLIIRQSADERTAFELWQFLHKKYTETNAQAIQNASN